MSTRPIPNESRECTDRPGTGNGLLTILAAPGSVSILSLADTTGTVRWYFWVDTSGNLRRANAIPTLPNSDGTVVGP